MKRFGRAAHVGSAARILAVGLQVAAFARRANASVGPEGAGLERVALLTAIARGFSRHRIGVGENVAAGVRDRPRCVVDVATARPW